MANEMCARKVFTDFLYLQGAILVIFSDVPAPCRIHVKGPSLMEEFHKQDREGFMRNPSELEELHHHSPPADEECPQDKLFRRSTQHP